MINKIFRKLRVIIKNPYVMLSKIVEGRAKILSDKQYLSIFYRASFGKPMSWDNPVTYNQKLQWLKIHDRNLTYKKLVDKFEVRDIIRSKIGDQYLIPLLGVWDNFDDINFSELPNQFVLKCTHDSGGVIICTDKNTFDISAARKKINKLMSRDFFWYRREWTYKNIKPRIIAEKYMVDISNNELKDYKIFTFNGEPKVLFVASDRNKPGEDVKFDYFDINFKKLNLRQTAHKNSDYEINKPSKYDEMLNVTRILSKDIPHVRIDLYDINGEVYFGEYTFYHHSGLVPFEPSDYDLIWGDMIDLDLINHNDANFKLGES